MPAGGRADGDTGQQVAHDALAVGFGGQLVADCGQPPVGAQGEAHGRAVVAGPLEGGEFLREAPAGEFARPPAARALPGAGRLGQDGGAGFGPGEEFGQLFADPSAVGAGDHGLGPVAEHVAPVLGADRRRAQEFVAAVVPLPARPRARRRAQNGLQRPVGRLHVQAGADVALVLLRELSGQVQGRGVGPVGDHLPQVGGGGAELQQAGLLAGDAVERAAHACSPR